MSAAPVGEAVASCAETLCRADSEQQRENKEPDEPERGDITPSSVHRTLLLLMLPSGVRASETAGAHSDMNINL